MAEEFPAAALRIGQLSRRLGVSEHVLRAWERRYGLLRPQRSAGGYRLYSAADEQRVRRMQAHLAAGVSAAQAAQAALRETEGGELAGPSPAGLTGRAAPTGTAPGADPAGPAPGAGLAGLAGELAGCLDRRDEPGAQALLDRLFAEYTVETALREAVLPYLRELGERWQRGEVAVADEHFASNLLRGRLSAMARGWGAGRGPRALLACAPGERHELALLMFGIVLHRRGWRVVYLGADTPAEDLARAAAEIRPDLTVVTAVTPEPFAGIRPLLTDLARHGPLALAGAGAGPELARAAGARLLGGDPVTEAERLSAATWPPPGSPGGPPDHLPAAAPR